MEFLGLTAAETMLVLFSWLVVAAAALLMVAGAACLVRRALQRLRRR